MAKGAGGGKKDLVLVASCSGIFLTIMRTAGLNPALPQIRRDFGAGVAGLQWVVNGYTLVVACLLLSASALADRVGARRTFMAGLGLFAGASALSAAAPTLVALVASQALIGVGAALLAPASLALIAHAFVEPARRARAVVLWSALAGLGAVAGPILGGILTGALGWRGIFLFDVPVAMVVLVVVARFVPETTRAGARGLDLAGQITGVIALGSLSLGLIEGGRQGWGSPVVLSALAVSVLGTLAFVAAELRVQRRGESPMLPLGFFADPSFSAGTAAGVALNFCNYGQLFLLSLFFADVRGYPPLVVGFAFLPLAFISFFGSVLAGRLTARFGARPPMVVGFALSAVGASSLLVLGEGSPYALVLPNLLLVGFGSGLVLPPATAAVVSSAPTGRAGVASAVINASRQASGVLGVALLGALAAGGRWSRACGSRGPSAPGCSSLGRRSRSSTCAIPQKDRRGGRGRSRRRPTKPRPIETERLPGQVVGAASRTINR